MHSKGVAHLDLKAENLLLDQKFKLKLTDFDLSQRISDGYVTSKGTIFYRPPEVIAEEATDLIKVDIYSLGIIHFVLKSGGIPPHLEDTLYNGHNF
mmetsp:Transcript_34370/g.31089  ORF Transcript_34370/g.31089 Transcript_34370/m.31089 type:complete len:96 (-) Transcript_34370:639-926(-)